MTGRRGAEVRNMEFFSCKLTILPRSLASEAPLLKSVPSSPNHERLPVSQSLLPIRDFIPHPSSLILYFKVIPSIQFSLEAILTRANQKLLDLLLAVIPYAVNL